MRRIALVAVMVAGLWLAASPAGASGEVANCGGDDALGRLTCSVTGPAMIDGTSFVGDGGSSAQYQWVGSVTAPASGVLTLNYVYTGIYNSLFAKLGMRLTVDQPTCDNNDHASNRVWVDPATADGVPGQISLRVACAGPVTYTITSRAATYSLGGSFVGVLARPTVTFGWGGGQALTVG